MGKGRLEAFSDGVIAIIITIMVLGLRSPQGNDLQALSAIVPTFFSYILSFILVGIYWNNHHHLLHTVKEVDGMVLWANLHLLFWLSLIPFTTRWVNDYHYASLPVALYGFVLLMAAVAYFILVRTLIQHHGKSSSLAIAIGNDIKGKLSIFIYASAVPLSFLNQWIAVGLYVLVGVIWFVPDRRIENIDHKSHGL